MVVKKSVLIVYNKASGRLRVERTLNKILRKLLHRYTVTTLNIECESFNDLRLNDIDSVIVIGGDGTVRSTVNALQHMKYIIPILIIPRGTANLVANSLDLPESVYASLNVFEHEKTRYIDIARTGRGDFFVGAFALGYLSDRITQTRYQEKRRFGFFGYMLSFMRQTKLPMHTFNFKIDGKNFTKQGHSLFIVNTADVFGFKSHRQISYRDGLFELVVTTNRSIVSFFGLIWDFYFRRKKPKHFFLERGTEFTIQANQYVSAQIDGELIKPEKAYSIQVCSGQQPFIIP